MNGSYFFMRTLNCNYIYVLIMEVKMKIRKNYGLFAVLCLLTVVALASCSKKQPAEKPAIKVNDVEISVSEFNKRFSQMKNSDDTVENRKLFLENYLNRKVLLLEAQRLGIDKEESFLDAVEKFWEQSLLKIVVDRKLKEISQNIKVSKQEVQQAAQKWLSENPTTTKSKKDIIQLIMKQRVREKQTLALNSWISDLRNQANIELDNELLGINAVKEEVVEDAAPEKDVQTEAKTQEKA